MPAQISPMPAPLDQGQTGTCVAQAVTLAADILWYRRRGRFLFDENSALELYVKATGDTTLEQGTYPRLVLAYAQKQGILGTDGTRYKIAAYHSLLPSANPQLAVEQAIGSLNLPVVAALDWPEDWMGTGAPVLPDPPKGEADAGGHCIVVWRYAMVHAKPDGTGALRVDDDLQNSWGAAFGKNGRAYAGASVLTGRCFDLWTLTV